ncbi:unnamed protein product [Mycena citricolor]|uniref:Uncharacterized protein n=1 Tax=Mycena citricolor TaxID=2018698 RepID=A0AAD2HQR7_9AGAR|nr:unnamed protein product [Mycena citricolor]
MDEHGEGLTKDALVREIQAFVASSATRLADVLEDRFAADSGDAPPQVRLWTRRARKLAKLKVPTYRYCLVGRTGSGKSTLTNCLLDALVVPSSAAVSAGMLLLQESAPYRSAQGACTSVSTEIKYHESETLEAVVAFCSKREWKQHVTELLNDMSVTAIPTVTFGALTRTGRRAESEEEKGHDSPADKARDTLRSVHPSYVYDPLVPISTAVATLMKEPVIREHVGKSISLTESATADLRDQVYPVLALLSQLLILFKLKIYLSAEGNPDTPKLWPLVDKVTIKGNFDVLSTGAVLVDIPGHGDSDDVRNKCAEQAVKDSNTSGVILVTDSRRAQDDRDTFDFLRKLLSQIIVDGRSVEEFIIFAATGSDNSIMDGEVTLSAEAQKKIAAIDSVGFPDALPAGNEAGPVRGHPYRKTIIQKLLQERSLIKATQDAPRLPVFVMGGQDYLKLSGIVSENPSVFTDVQQTNIPLLRKHLYDTADEMRTKWGADCLERLATLAEDMHEYFITTDSPVHHVDVDQKETLLTHIKALRRENEKELESALSGIKDELHRVQDCLEMAVNKAMFAAPGVVRTFGLNIHWSSYRAMMRKRGFHGLYNLNRSLTVHIFEHIKSTWNVALNHRVPLILREAVEETIMGNTQDCVEAIAESLKEEAVLTRILPEFQSLLREMLVQALDVLSDAQRVCTRSFVDTVRTEMGPEYEAAMQIKGRGSLVQMKASNEWYLRDYGEAVFGAINISVDRVLHEALAKIGRQINSDLDDLAQDLQAIVNDPASVMSSDDDEETRSLILEQVDLILKSSIMKNLDYSAKTEYESDCDWGRSGIHE